MTSAYVTEKMDRGSHGKTNTRRSESEIDLLFRHLGIYPHRPISSFAILMFVNVNIALRYIGLILGSHVIYKGLLDSRGFTGFQQIKGLRYLYQKMIQISLSNDTCPIFILLINFDNK